MRGMHLRSSLSLVDRILWGKCVGLKGIILRLRTAERASSNYARMVFFYACFGCGNDELVQSERMILLFVQDNKALDTASIVV